MRRVDLEMERVDSEEDDYFDEEAGEIFSEGEYSEELSNESDEGRYDDDEQAHVPHYLGEDDEDGLQKNIYRMMVVAYFTLMPSYFWYRWLYTIEWDLPYRMYYQTTICVAEMFGARPTRAP
jgi:hypothetical protein